MILPYHPFTVESQQDVNDYDPHEYQIEIFPTDWQLAPGHRLRVVIGTADTPGSARAVAERSLPEAPESYVAHEPLRVDGTRVPWRYDGVQVRVSVDAGVAALARGGVAVSGHGRRFRATVSRRSSKAMSGFGVSKCRLPGIARVRTSEMRYAPRIPSNAPNAAPMSRFKVILRI